MGMLPLKASLKIIHEAESVRSIQSTWLEFVEITETSNSVNSSRIKLSDDIGVIAGDCNE